MAHETALMSGAKAVQLDRELIFGRVALLERVKEEVRGERPPSPPFFKCLLVGVTVAIVYVWPTELLIYLYVGGYSSALFNGLVAAGFVFGTAAAWIITALETRYWKRNWHKVSEYADPPYWR